MRNRERRNLFLLPVLFVAAAAAVGLLWMSGKTAMAAEGVKPPPPRTELPQEGQSSATAVFAGGCFWCTEAVLEPFRGVTEVVSGYAGGSKETATYPQVSAGKTDHAEAVRVTYDPGVISYAKLMQLFFASIDPTSGNGQAPDFGKQYRPAVFYATPEQKKLTEDYIKQLDAAAIYDKPVAVHVEPLTEFYPAEEYHQDYAKKNPNDGYVRGVSLPKVKKVHGQFPELLKGADAGAANDSPAAWQVAVREEQVGEKVSKPAEQWKKELTKEEYYILREEGTEAPFSSPLNKEKRAGVFRCAACELSLFESPTKFESGTGWPSFYDTVKGHVDLTADGSLGMERTRLKCARCGSHLGHVFDDGPQPTGKRYCIDGVSLKFQPAGEIKTGEAAAAKAE